MGDQEDEGAAPVGGKLFELSMSDADKKGFISFYKGLPENDQVVRFFDRKEYYSVHGAAADFVARTFYRTTSVVKTLGSGENALPGVTLNRVLFETVVRQLLLEGSERTVEIWEEQGKSWHRTRVASPGQLSQLEDILFRSQDMEEVPILLALKLQVRDTAHVAGVAFLNPLSRELGACEITDDAQLTALEGVLVQLGARECIVSREAAAASTPAGRRLRDVLSRCGVLANEQKEAEFSAKDLESDLSRLISGNIEVHRQLLDKPAAASALAALIRVAELAAESSADSRKYSLSQFEAGRFMRLDASASRALNVTKERGDAADTFSLYKLLNRAKTPMGKRLLLRWLHQPLLDPAAIDRRLDVVESLVQDSELRDLIRTTHLRAAPDVERLALKLERRKATLQDLCRLYQASTALPLVAEALRRHEGEHAEALHEAYAAPLERLHSPTHLVKFEQLIETAVDLDKIPDEFLISAAYDEQLGELAAERDRLEDEIQAAFSKAASDLGLERDKVLKMESNAQHGWFLRLTKKEETAVRKQLEGARYLILEHRKDGTKFTTPALKALSSERLALDRSYQQQQRHLVERVVDVAASFCDVFFEAAAVLSELDVLAGFADLAASAPAPYTRPALRPTGEGDIVLEACRHPCVEVQEGVSFVPNDCRLKRGSSWFHVITGPNMGGKSTFIRQVGVCVLMAQVGCFVPAARAEVSVCDAIFARVGAGDCQLRGISTFMAEMLETASILKAATPSSLIIIDELGRGTSTYDGFGLAWAISEHIAEKIRGPCLFATHFHELTALKGGGGVANFHVEAAVDAASRRLTMLYAVRPGACDRSFGIHCAEFARFPREVLEAARAKAEELEGLAGKRKRDGVGEEEAAAKRARGEDGGAQQAAAAAGSAGGEQARAAARARAFLKELAAVPLEAMPRAEAQRALRALREGLERDAAGMPALRAMMAAGA